MTKQEVFDRVWDHFVVRCGLPSVDMEGTCLYRGPDGVRCAIGLLIPDEVYQPHMEIAVSILIDNPTIEELFRGIDTPFLTALQDCHDYATLKLTNLTDHSLFTRLIRENLEYFAANNKLTISDSGGVS